VRGRRAIPFGAGLALALALPCAPAASPGEADAAASPRIALPPVTDPAWEPVTLPGVESETSYRVIGGEGVTEEETALRAEADCSASGRVVRFSDVGLDVDLARTPVLRWRWRVVEGLEVADERSREGDDFAARVSVLFPFEPEHAGWLETLGRGVTERLYEREIPGSALYFVWTDRIEPGTVWENPYTPSVMMRAVARGDTGGWRSEAVDVARSFREAFGRDAPTPAAVGVMTDSDNQCARAVALYADFHFTAPGAGRAPAPDADGGAPHP